MKSWLQHPFRLFGRLMWLGWVLTLAAFDFLFQCAFRKKTSALAARASWVRRGSCRMLRVFGVESQVAGKIPSNGLLVTNHLSYLDIFVLAALTPAVFIAKREVRHWPLLGFFSKLGGTLFIDRERRGHVGEMNEKIQTVLDSGVLVILFPEGTSSGGETVLPFKSSLLEPATRQTHAIFAGLIRYELDDGDAAEEVCYWKDMTLAPHLLNLLTKRAVRASVRFSRLQQGSTDRKELALQLHREVLKLKTSVAV